MDPFTMFAVANAVVSGVSTVYNYFAGQSQFEAAKAKMKEQQGILDQSKALAAQNFDQTNKDINQALLTDQQNVHSQVSSLGATMAQNGVLGPESGVVQGNAEARGDQQADITYASRVATADSQYQGQLNQFASQQNQLDQGNANIQAKQDQFGMDTVTGLIGTGLSAFGAMAKGGLFDAKPAAAAFDPYKMAGVTSSSPYQGAGVTNLPYQAPQFTNSMTLDAGQSLQPTNIFKASNYLSVFKKGKQYAY